MGAAGAKTKGAACFAIILSTLSAGCAVGPDFATPQAPIADDWIDWRNRSLKTGPAEFRDWWRVFHDPVLDRLIDIAYAQNLTLLSAGTKVLQARAALGVAIGELFPQKQILSISTSYNRSSNATTPSQGGNSSKLGNFWADSWAASLVWEVDF